MRMDHSDKALEIASEIPLNDGTMRNVVISYTFADALYNPRATNSPLPCEIYLLQVENSRIRPPRGVAQKVLLGQSCLLGSDGK